MKRIHRVTSKGKSNTLSDISLRAAFPKEKKQQVSSTCVESRHSFASRIVPFVDQNVLADEIFRELRVSRGAKNKWLVIITGRAQKYVVVSGDWLILNHELLVLFYSLLAR